MTPMVKRISLILAVLFIFGLGIYGLRLNKLSQIAAMSGRAFPPATISVAEVKSSSWRQSLFAVGSVVAEQGVDVTAPLPGTVVDIKFNSGTEVKKGELLVQMDIGVDLAQLEGLIASKELRELQFKRAKKLFDERQISRSDFDVARAALDEASAEMLTKKEFIARKRVYAPFDGTLGIRMIDLGDHLEPGDPVVPLQMLDPIHVDYALPEQFLSQLQMGQVIEIEVPAYPGQRYTGVITAFDPGIDPNTRNINIRATIENPLHQLRPGMFAEVWTIDPANKTVLLLPETSITYSPFGDTVFLVVDENDAALVERRQVQVGEVRNGEVEITKGLIPGDRVVAVGQNKLRNGMPVQITDRTFEP